MVVQANQDHPKRKLGKDGQVEEYKYWFVTPRFVPPKTGSGRPPSPMYSVQ